MKTRIVPLLLVSVIFIFIAAQCSSNASTSAPQSPANTQPAGSQLDGKTLLQDRCTVCHPMQRVTSQAGSASEWKSAVDIMIRRGAQLTPQEETVLVSYLAQTYP